MAILTASSSTLCCTDITLNGESQTTFTPENKIWVKPINYQYIVNFGRPTYYTSYELKRTKSQEPLVTANISEDIQWTQTTVGNYKRFTSPSYSAANFTATAIAHGNYLFLGDELTFSAYVANGGYYSTSSATSISQDSQATQLNRFYFNTQTRKMIYKTKITEVTRSTNKTITFPMVRGRYHITCISNSPGVPIDNFSIFVNYTYLGTTYTDQWDKNFWWAVFTNNGPDFYCDEGTSITLKMAFPNETFNSALGWMYRTSNTSAWIDTSGRMPVTFTPTEDMTIYVALK